MPEVRARFYFDYVDPESYLAERWIREMEAEVGGLVRRHPYEINPPPRPLLDPRVPAWASRWRKARGRASAEGIELVAPVFVPWSRKAHELALHALEKGVFAEMHEALFRAFHEEGLDIGRVDVLVELAGRTHLDTTETRVVLDVDRHAEGIVTLRGEAEAAGIVGVPTLDTAGRRLEHAMSRESLRSLLGPGAAPD